MTIREAINAGYPQHAAIVFDGSFDIVDNERIMLNDGFTLTQTYCSEENLTPGFIANDHFSSRLMNDDGALTGFDFERSACLLLGVEDGPYTDLSDVHASNASVALKLHNKLIVLSETNVLVYRNENNGWSVIDYAENIVVTKNTTVDDIYYLFVLQVSSGQKKVYKKYDVAPDGTITRDTSFSAVVISDYAWNRIDLLRQNHICECWAPASSQCKVTRFVVDSYKVKKVDVLFNIKSCFMGTKPRSTSSKIVLFSASTDFTKLDQSANDYANAVWTSSKTLGRIAKDVSRSEYTNYPSQFNQVSFSSNPFYGNSQLLSGCTYRDLLSYVCAAAGTVSVPTAYMYITDDTGFAKFNCFSRFNIKSHISDGNSPNITLEQDEYFNYDAADYFVKPIEWVVFRSIIPQNGVYVENGYGDNINGTTFYSVGNPLMEADNSSMISILYDGIKDNSFGNYYPCSFESYLGAVIRYNNTIAITLNDGTVRWMPVFVLTINWNGSANCIVECTGKENYNQFDDPAFRGMIQNANQAYLIADGVQPSSSSVNVKHDLNRITGSGIIVDNLRPVTFKYNNDPDEKLHYGLIYEEVVDKYPALCRQSTDDTKKRINYQELVPILLAEVQDLRKRLKDLENGNNSVAK